MQVKRFAFVDHYRGWAVIVMIEVHAVNAWLSDSVRHESWFPYLNNLNGLVAPSFLFIAGVSFAIIVARKFEKIGSFSPDFFKLLRRFAWIWLLGYLLHLPRIRWSGNLPSVEPGDLASFYQTDVLQIIALSLIVLLLLCAILRERRRFYAATALLALLALLLTPTIWSYDFSGMHPFFASYLNGRNNPLFPMFPWAVFVWAGALSGGLFLSHAAQGREASGILKLLTCGIVLFAAGSLLRNSGWIPYRNFWLESPWWVMMRLALVLSFFALFWRLEKRGIAGLAPVLLVGSESLFAYVFHLMGIYWITGEKAAVSLLKYRGYPLSDTLGLYAVLLIATMAATYVWVRVRKRNSPQRLRGHGEKETEKS